MKKKCLYALTAAMALTAGAQSYKLVIHTKSGEILTMPTEEIEKMVFEEADTPPEPGGQLSAPKVAYEKVSDNSVKVYWEDVPGADSYFWRFDTATTSITDDTSYTLRNLSEGSHTFTVQALAPKGSVYTDSEPTTITFNVSTVNDGSMRFFIENFTHCSARISFSPGNAPAYKVAVIPASSATSDGAIISLMESLPENQAHSISAKCEKVFEGLSPDTEYVVAAIPSDRPASVFSRRFTTEPSPVTGATMSIFPPGVSKAAGFVDVDKVGATDYGPDGELCWACVAAGMTQWWLDDYKASTGTDYPLKYPFPAQSKYYSTSVMDVISQAYTHQAGDVHGTLHWLFSGVEHPESFIMNNEPLFNLDYEHVKGGFLGMTDNEFDTYCEETSATGLLSGKTADEAKALFSDKMIGWLRHGPVYVCISGNHALCAWGADYTVQPDGSKLVTKLYIAENDLVNANIKNALQDAPVYYTSYSDRTNYPYITLPSIWDGGSEKTGSLGVFCSIRSWESVNGK